MLCFFLFAGIWSAFAQDDIYGLKVGDVAPDFTLTDQNERPFRLSKALEKGPVVVFFYMTGSREICNKYIKNYQDSLQLIKGKGAQIVGVSPQQESSLLKTIEKTGATFPLLIDSNKKVCYKYQTLLKEHMANEEANPVTAVYVIGKDGKVSYVNFPNTFTVRANVSDFLPFL